ncbi:hypothetical protein Ahy_A07g034311 [Arachis hypogaea]|uniref:Replication factor A C-terminal domain-containing protein n=1 Tax=Arachis hypogaea TaxID=3818 RepID=A0A445CBL5_ARAHY|nr:hypothetical protein Ahy_A07g034311 [Arachis hypogaea]
MASSFNLLKNIEAANESPNYKIKVTVLKLWSISPKEQKFQKSMLEMVVMDEVGDRIQCSIRSPQRRLFEGDLSDGMIYTLSNFLLALNDQKYKPTSHSHRIYFKRETQLRMVSDVNFPSNVFRFVPNDLILNHTNAQSHLIDVMGLFIAKGDIIEFYKNGNKSIYIVIELDDMEIIMSGVPHANQLTQIAADPAYNLEDDLLNRSTYKPIRELKELIENGSYVTIGTVLAIDSKNGWWYKGCKQCFHSLKESDTSYHCTTCDTFPSSHTPRYSINLRVADDTETALFILYDKEATIFLGTTASELRLAQLTRILFNFVCSNGHHILLQTFFMLIQHQNLGGENSELLSIQTDSVDTIKV